MILVLTCVLSATIFLETYFHVEDPRLHDDHSRKSSTLVIDAPFLGNQNSLALADFIDDLSVCSRL